VISGGVSSIDEVVAIKKSNPPNIEGVIVGKAIYDGNIDIKKLGEII
jgi:phosphoribosylformimino-5-aminoimidazole carboxamide ribotide isomerase